MTIESSKTPVTPTMTSILPITNPSTTPVANNHKKLTLIPVIFIIFFEVAGGPYGEEPAVKAAGPFMALLGFSIFPFIWSVPEALVTTELSTTFPGNGGYIIWAEKAFGTFFGSLLGTLKYITSVINLVAFPILCIDYMAKLFPILDSGWPRIVAIVCTIIVLTAINLTGLDIVGYASIILGVASIAPFIALAGFAIPKIKPHRWLSMGKKEKNWNLFFNTLFWNLNFWDSVSTMAGEVDNPKTTFPKALSSSVLLTCVSYIVPLLSIIGALELDQNQWESGYMAVAAEMIAGKWLKIWLEVGAAISAIGLFEALLTSCSFQVLGMSDFGFLSKFFEKRSRFNTPWIGIVVSSLITIGFSFLHFEKIISCANFIYSLGMLLEFASFIWLRVKFPNVERPFSVPLNVPGLVVMCLIPSAFLILIMFIATEFVYLVSGAMTVGAILWYFLMNFVKRKKWLAFNNGDEMVI